MRVLHLLAFSAAAALFAPPATSQFWSDRFAPPSAGGLGFDVGDHTTSAFAVFDSGSGPELYVGGAFLDAGGTPVNNIARWTGSGWADVGGGVQVGTVNSMIVWDDGTGPALYVAGGFGRAGSVTVNSIAKWDGTTWSDVGGGLYGAAYVNFVPAMAVFDDGTGEALYCGGAFQLAGTTGEQVLNLAKWDGTKWADVGGGVANPVFNCCVWALEVFDDGTGPALYVGGEEGLAGGSVNFPGIARWDGTSWSQLGTGLSGAYINWATAMHVWDDGTGDALYVGGCFTTAGSVTANNIAKWDGSQWSALGGGMTGDGTGFIGCASPGFDMVGFDSGSGEELWVAGRFLFADGVRSENIARWDGAQWRGARSGVHGPSTAYPANVEVNEMIVFDDPTDGAGPALWVMGEFEIAGSQQSSHIGVWGPTQPTLSADNSVMVLDALSTQNMTLDAGAGEGGNGYVVLGSASGTFPGLSFQSVTIPLNGDAYFSSSILGVAPIVGSVGVLGASGTANAQLVLPSLPSGLSGLILSHAFVTVSGSTINLASNPIQAVLR
ncbi:MAG: hypothetical protein AAF628_01210 [Planctomycetota bacterium]